MATGSWARRMGSFVEPHQLAGCPEERCTDLPLSVELALGDLALDVPPKENCAQGCDSRRDAALAPSSSLWGAHSQRRRSHAPTAQAAGV